jgi:PadR family transcriptional regulator, regulatory protein PadR
VFAGKNAFLQGTLELLILKAVSWGAVHGYGIARWIEQTTEDVLRVEDGSLYPALYRLSRRGLLKGEWGLTENGRRAKYYTLTASGRRQLTEQVSGWHRLAVAVTHAVNSRRAPVGAR